MQGGSNACSASREPRVWVVDSAYTGELHARMGVAERLHCSYEILPLPDGDPDTYRDMVRRKASAGPRGSEARPLVILSGTGEETTAEIADLKLDFRDRLVNVFLASILPEQPHPRLRDYDLVASPQIEGPNVIRTLGIPHRVTREALNRASAAHEAFFATLRRPVIAVLVGGNTRYCFGFDASHARGLARRVKRLTAALRGSLVVTNSRRTPPAAWSALTDELGDRDVKVIDWQRSQRDLYLALLAEGDVFVTTGDSLSMCSEVSYTGKPLLIDLSVETTECFHRDILAKLLEHGAARPLTDRFEPWSYVPPDPTGTVAVAIRGRLRGGQSG